MGEAGCEQAGALSEVQAAQLGHGEAVCGQAGIQKEGGEEEGIEMTDAQIFTMAMAVIIPLSMLIYSNSRITEAKDTLRAEIGELRGEMRAGFQRIEMLLKVHELEHHK